jgi:hypothetical protein
MKPAWIALALSLILVGCFKAPGVTMNQTEMKEALAQLAEQELGLQPVPCPQLNNGPLCFSAPYSAEDFGERVDALSAALRAITGWRDDYGVLNGAFEFSGQDKEVAIAYVRPDTFWDQPRFAELVRRQAKGYVSISVTDEAPRDR